SLGAILYELLTGRPPFQAETSWETVLQVLQKEPEPPSQWNPDTDRDLEAICLKCLAKDPQQRYLSAAALAEDLEHWLTGEPLVVRPPSRAVLMWRWLRQNIRATGWVILIGLLCGLVGPLGLAIRFFRPLLAEMSVAYARLPAQEPSGMIDLDLPVSDSTVTLLIYVGFAFFLGSGLLIQWTVRPRDVWGDVLTGLASGGLAGLIAFLLFLGPT